MNSHLVKSYRNYLLILYLLKKIVRTRYFKFHRRCLKLIIFILVIFFYRISNIVGVSQHINVYKCICICICIRVCAYDPTIEDLQKKKQER